MARQGHRGAGWRANWWPATQTASAATARRVARGHGAQVAKAKQTHEQLQEGGQRIFETMMAGRPKEQGAVQSMMPVEESCPANWYVPSPQMPQIPQPQLTDYWCQMGHMDMGMNQMNPGMSQIAYAQDWAWPMPSPEPEPEFNAAVMMPALAGMSGAEVAALLANAAKDLVYEVPHVPGRVPPVEESDEEEQVFQLVVKQTFLEYIPTARRPGFRARARSAPSRRARQTRTARHPSDPVFIGLAFASLAPGSGSKVVVPMALSAGTATRARTVRYTAASA
ncbi:unnamed protein product [Effrenium voratum]|nr:unnamed protein product [Effrenium voratum]